MAMKVNRAASGELVSIVISCDVPDCTTTAPDDKTIAAAGGLRNMGWYCAGGQHFCPDHAKEHENGRT